MRIPLRTILGICISIDYYITIGLFRCCGYCNHILLTLGFIEIDGNPWNYWKENLRLRIRNNGYYKFSHRR